MPKREKPPMTGPDDERHGTLYGYINVRCRCAECREAHRVYESLRRLEGPKAETPHGTYSTYVSRKCRCEPCRAAASEYRNEYRKSHKDAQTLARWGERTEVWP